MIDLLAQDPNATATCWYESQLVTVGGTLGGLVIGLLLQPLVQGWIRHQQRQEEKEDQWLDDGRRLTAELGNLVNTEFLRDDSVKLMLRKWQDDLRDRTFVYWRFHPDKEVRINARKASGYVEKTVFHARERVNLPDVDVRRVKHLEEIRKYVAEARYALAVLAHSLGSVPVPPRKEWNLPEKEPLSFDMKF